MPQLSDYLFPFYEAGLDGAIIQDMGVFFYVKKHFPGLALQRQPPVIYLFLFESFNSVSILMIFLASSFISRCISLTVFSVSEEYLQKVASYINNKIMEYSKIESYKRQPIDMQNVLMQLNIAYKKILLSVFPTFPSPPHIEFSPLFMYNLPIKRNTFPDRKL